MVLEDGCGRSGNCEPITGAIRRVGVLAGIRACVPLRAMLLVRETNLICSSHRIFLFLFQNPESVNGHSFECIACEKSFRCH